MYWNKNAARDAARNYLPFILIFILPFVLYIRFIVPIHGNLHFISNDFSALYYSYKYILLDSLANGYIPLWHPGEAAGYPLYSNPFAQFFYPLNVPLYLFRIISGEYSLFMHEIYTFFAIGIFGIGTYLWLRKINIPAKHALVAVIFILMNARFADIIRFPNAVHAAAWMPFCLHAITLCFASRHGKASIAYLMSALILLVTAGYPYYAYYSIFLLGPYVLIFFSLRLTESFGLPVNLTFSGKLHGIRRVCIAVACAVLLLLPYLIKVAQLMSATADREGASYDYATAHVFSFTDMIGSWLFPSLTQSEGIYFLGSVPVILILAYALFAVRRFKSYKNDALFILSAFIFIIFISLITAGRQSCLFDLFWHYLPGFSSLRVWGRLNIVLLPILSLLIARALFFFHQLHGANLRLDVKFLLPAVFLYCLLQIYFLFNDAFWDIYWLTYHQEAIKLLHLVPLSTFLLFTLILAVHFTKYKNLAIIVVIAIIINAISLVPINNKLWYASTSYKHFTSCSDYDTNLFRANFNEKRLPAPRCPGSNHCIGIIPNWFYNRYINFLDNYLGDGDKCHDNLVYDDKFSALMGMDNGQRIFFHSELNFPDIGAFLDDSRNTTERSDASYKILNYTGSLLKLSVVTQKDVFLSYIDNIDPDWYATIDDMPVPMNSLFGTFKTVSVPTGTHTIEFKYVPFSF